MSTILDKIFIITMLRLTVHSEFVLKRKVLANMTRPSTLYAKTSSSEKILLPRYSDCQHAMTSKCVEDPLEAARQLRMLDLEKKRIALSRAK